MSATAEARSRSGVWYINAFRHDYLERYAHRDDGLGRREAAFALRALGVKPGDRVLDLCCGGGRHSRALARAGLSVTGVDLSHDLLAAARRESAGLNIEYLRADMRAIPLAGASVDGVASLFTSFGYFCEEAHDLLTLREIARVLKPGRRLLLDFFNRATTLRRLNRSSRRIAGGVYLRERRWYDGRRSRLNKMVLHGPYDRRAAILESVRAYSPRELQSLLTRAELRILALHGDLSGADFDARTSLRCVLIAEKA